MTDSKPPRPPISVSADDAILILEEADLASSAGVPLSPGLRAMAAEAWPGRFRRSLLQLADRLDEGEPLPTVLQSLQPSLSPITESLVQEGADCGRMDLILHWSTEQGRRRRNLRFQLGTALAYPFFLLAVAALIAGFVLIMIVSKFEQIFRDFGTQLPALTHGVLWLSRALIWVSQPFLDHWGMTLVGAGLLAAIVLIVAPQCDWISRPRWWGRIPLVGPLFRLVALADFCQFLAILIEIRSPLPKAVRLAGRASGDKWLMNAGEELAAAIEAGNLSAATSTELQVPAAIGQLLSSLSTPESLAEALYGLAEIYSVRAEVNCRFVAVIVEPIVMTVTTVGLGAIVVGLLIPLVKLLNDLS